MCGEIGGVQEISGKFDELWVTWGNFREVGETLMGTSINFGKFKEFQEARRKF